MTNTAKLFTTLSEARERLNAIMEGSVKILSQIHFIRQ